MGMFFGNVIFLAKIKMYFRISTSREQGTVT
jgi:hypothetical protein